MNVSNLAAHSPTPAFSPFGHSSLPAPAASSPVLGPEGPQSVTDWGGDPRCDPLGLICLGPEENARGCGAVGTTGVPDWLAGLDLTRACFNHDADSPPLFERSDKPLGAVLATQARFFRDIVASGGDSWLGKLGAVAVAIPYTAAVTTVGVAQWAVNRVLDGWDCVSSAASGLWSAAADIGSSIGSTVAGWFS